MLKTDKKEFILMSIQIKTGNPVTTIFPKTIFTFKVKYYTKWFITFPNTIILDSSKSDISEHYFTNHKWFFFKTKKTYFKTTVK